MDTDIQIVQATIQHAEELAKLNDVVQKMHVENHPKIFKYPANSSEVADFFRAKITTQKNLIFLALASECNVGYVWCTIDRRKENPFKHQQSRIFIHQIAVATEFRNMGIGRKLLKAIDEIAIQENIDCIALDSWEFNQQAQTFFERVGFTRYNINLWREVRNL